MAKEAGSKEPRPRADALRALPSVERLAAALPDVPHAVAVQAARAVVAERRAAIEAGAPDATQGVEADVRARALELTEATLRRVLNATGVIIHTNLGRAPLATSARAAVTRAAEGYTDLEYDLATGERGSRQHHVEGLLRELTGAEAGMAVNNCAAAVLLAAGALAAGRELLVSRGQLVEIGGSFRIPDVVAQSGARLVEVGTTNRTRLSDYERAVGPGTGAVLRAHQSNFRTVGFVEEVTIEELCGLGPPVIDDIGSGLLADGIPGAQDEPAVRRSVAAGAALVCFSGDKLLGGPQAGGIVGSEEAVARCRAHPLARAVRIDKLSLAALEATLRLYRDPAAAQRELPVLAMLSAPREELERRARAMAALVPGAEVIEAEAAVGGGALPLLELSGPVCAIDPGAAGLDALAARLRAGDPPLVGRAREGRLLLDPRTLSDPEAERAAGRVADALG